MVTTGERPTVPGAPPARRRRPGRTRPGAAVAPRVTTGRVAEASHRNPAWLLGGLLLVLVSALGGMLLFSAGDDRTEALVAAGDLAAGHVVERGDLRVRRVAVDGVDVVTPAEVDRLVGQHTIGPLPAGALLHPAMFSTERPIGPDEMDIGAALDPGEFPLSRIPIGASVELLVAAAVSANGGPEAPPAADADGPDTTAGAPGATSSGGGAWATMEPIGRGTVVAVEERASGQLLVTVRVNRDVGLVAAQASAEDMLRLAMVGDDS